MYSDPIAQRILTDRTLTDISSLLKNHETRKGTSPQEWKSAEASNDRIIPASTSHTGITRY